MSVIAVDVDLTVVDTLTPWMRQFKTRTGEFIKNESGSYDLLPEMSEIIKRKGIKNYDPYSFWCLPDLYDDMEPVPYCVDELRKLQLMGNQIVFVSTCIPTHIDSKKRFLNKYFPWADGFIDTKDKHFVAYDVLIDDKIEHLRLGDFHRGSALHLLYTGIRLDGKPGEADDYEEMADWRNLYFHVYGNDPWKMTAWND